MTRLILLGLLLIGTGWSAAPRPNIIFVLTDDLGWGDLGVFHQNSRDFATNRNRPAMATPMLDAMAAQGIRMDRHYCPAPVCAPSRASFLLGLHQGHSNVRDNQFDKELANNHTVGTVLRQAGYATAAIGKWGLQGGADFPSHPQNRGFDAFFGYMAHLDAHFHYPKEQGRAYYDGFSNVAADLDKCYSTDLATARTKKWITDHRSANPAQPFFVFLAYAAPHAQLNVPTTAYPAGGGLTGGVQWTGTPGAMINTAIGTVDTWIHPDYATATWDHDSNPATAEQPWPTTAKRHATMVRRIDDAIGDLQKLLQDLKIDENTLVVFTSDNGPHNEAGSGGGSIGAQDPQFFRSYGPFSGIKRDVWEGGIRVPTLARWPAAIPAGRVSSHPSQFHDWLTTFARLAGAPSPLACDGVSLVPDLTGTPGQREGIQYIEYQNGGAASTPNYAGFHPSHITTRGHMQALFLDGYKGIRYNTTATNTPFRVYDMTADPTETTNLAGQVGVPSQGDFEARIARLRRPGGGVTRVYDGVRIPPLNLTGTTQGLSFRAYEADYPWVPDFDGETPVATGETPSPLVSVRTRDENIGLEFSGFIEIPTDGDYTFFLTTDSGAFIRLHETRLLDADYGYPAGTERSSGTIPLLAGLHPIRLHYRHTTAASHSLTLQWQGPGIAKQPIPASAWRTITPLPTTPQANNDSATTTAGQAILIDVLANDLDDGLPAPLAIASVGTPDLGTAVIEAGKIRYTPPAGFVGTAAFTYTITDGAETASATVTVTVTEYTPPAAQPDLAYAIAGAATIIPVLQNDQPSAALSIAAITQPATGTAEIEGITIRFTAPADFTGTTKFSYTVTDGGPGTSSATVTVVASPADDWWLPFDENTGNTIIDATGKATTTTNPAATRWVPGRFGSALRFTGAAGDHLDLAGFTGIPGTAPRTVSAWIKTTGTGQMPIIAWGPNSNGNKWTFLAQNGRLRIEVTGGFREGSTLINDGQWHHVAATFANDGTPDVLDVILYIDGVPESSFTTQSARTINTTASINVRVGSDVQDRNFIGDIDDARIIPRALTSAEITALATATPAAHDASLWHCRFFANPQPDTAAWARDDNRDGITSLLAYALGGSPHISNQNIHPTLSRDPAALHFLFNRRQAIPISAYIVETATSPELADWSPLPIAEITSHPDLAAHDRVRVVIPPGSPRRFARLRFQL